MESLEDMLVRHEGLVLHAYEDSLGFLTLGVGRLIDKRRGGGITEEEARYLLKNDIQKAVHEARQFAFYDALNNVRKQVIVSMIFNLGIGGFSTFKNMIAALERKDYAEAAREMLHSKWARQVKGRAVELATAMHTGQPS